MSPRLSACSGLRRRLSSSLCLNRARRATDSAVAAGDDAGEGAAWPAAWTELTASRDARTARDALFNISLSRLSSRDPGVDLLFEARHWQRSRHQHLGMKVLDVELVPELPLRLGAKPLDGHGAALLGQSLARDGDGALDLVLGVGLAHARIVEHVLDRLLAAPALGMDAGVDHQAHRAQHLIIERAHALVWVLVEAHRVTERLRIEGPAFDISGIAAEPHERRQRRILLRQADLEVVAGRTFMQVQSGHARRGPRRQVIGVEVEDAGTRAVR